MSTINRRKAAVLREFEHGSDLGIELSAVSRCELFAGALEALAALMVEPEGINPCEERQIKLAPLPDSDLLHDLLSAALTVFLVDGFIWHRARVAECLDKSIRASLIGEPFAPQRHRLIQELKAITYHQLVCERRNGRWRARLVIDV